ncbi:unnamed protein product [Scytosiphon promiscuus]
MLTGPKSRTEGPDGEEIFTGEESFTDGGGASAGGKSGMPGRGRGRDNDSSQHGGSAGPAGVASGAGEGSSRGAFGDYDEEEVAALEAYMKTHPSKEEDKEALRKRAKELSARIGSDQEPDSKIVGGASRTTVVAAGAGAGGTSSKPPPSPEEPIEYTDASGRLKFNKRPVAGGAVDKADSVGKRDKKKGKRAKLAKLSNAKLLSFGDDEDG